MACYFFANPHTPVFAAEARHVLAIGVLAYLLDGVGWIMYFLSIISGPITIVGTLSAAYPALTVLFAHWFLGETLSPLQYGRCGPRDRRLHRACLPTGGRRQQGEPGGPGFRSRSRPSCCGAAPRRSSSTTTAWVPLTPTWRSTASSARCSHLAFTACGRDAPATTP